MPDKISVIIPAYNCGRYLDESITSVLAQTWTNFEIIVVDDGSTDNTSEVLDTYKADARIKSVYQKNMGVGEARNRGMRLSEGEYICFLDADDVLEPESLGARHDVLAAGENIAMVFSDYTLRHDGNHSLPQHLHHKGFTEFFSSALVPSPPGCMMFNDRFIELFYDFSPHPIWTGTVMLRRSVIDSVGFFRTDIALGEDTDYWLRIAEKHRFAYIDKPTAVYNHYRSNLTNDTRRYCEARLGRLKSIPLASHALKEAVHRNISDTHCHLGYHYYQNNSRLLAAFNYLLGLRYNAHNTLCFKGLAACSVPHCLSRGVKAVFASARLDGVS